MGSSRKAATEPHQATLSPMGYLKIPERVGALVGIGAGVQVEILADPERGVLTVRRLEAPPARAQLEAPRARLELEAEAAELGDLVGRLEDSRKAPCR